MRCPLLLGRDSWMRFHSRSYQTLSPQPDGRMFGELTLSLCNNNLGSAAAYIRDRESSDAVYHLVYDGLGLSLIDSPQLIPVNLVCLDGSSALTGHYIVELFGTIRLLGPTIDSLDGTPDLEPGDVLGTASSPLLRVPLEALTLHNVPDRRLHPRRVAYHPNIADSPSLTTASDSPDEPPRTSTPTQPQPARIISSPLEHCASHIRRIDFAPDAPGWGSPAIDALSKTLAAYADVFSFSKLDYGECSLRPFEIKVPLGTQPIQSRPYRLNPVLSKQVDAILDSYLAAGLIQHSTSPWSSPLVCVPKKSGGIRITVNYQKLNKVTRSHRLRFPASTRCLTPGRRFGFLRVRPFLGVHSFNYPPSPGCLLHAQRPL